MCAKFVNIMLTLKNNSFAFVVFPLNKKFNCNHI